MEPIDLKNLHDGVQVLARFAKRDTEDGCAPDWSEPQTVTLFVRRSEKDLKKGKKTIRPAGTIIELTIKEFSWASYDENDFCPEYNDFLAEEYRMQILEIKTEPFALQEEKSVV